MRTAQEILLLGAVNTLLAFGMGAQQTGQGTQPPAASGAPSQGADPSAKPKKVWTDDDVSQGGDANTARNGRKPEKRQPAASSTTKDSQAESLRAQLTKLQGQLDDTNAKLAKLQEFNGDASPDTAIKLNQRLVRKSKEEQIAELQTKKKKIEGQIEDIYDQARRRGIEPALLR